jgi:hypothetical protein
MVIKKSKQNPKSDFHKIVNKPLKLSTAIFFLLIAVSLISMIVVINSRGSLDPRSWAKSQSQCLTFNQTREMTGQPKMAVEKFKSSCISQGGFYQEYTEFALNGKSYNQSQTQIPRIPRDTCYTCLKCVFTDTSKNISACPYNYDLMIGRITVTPGSDIRSGKGFSDSH